MKTQPFKIALMLLIVLMAKGASSQDRIIFYDALDFSVLYKKYQEGVAASRPANQILIDTNVVKILSYYFPELKLPDADPIRIVGSNPFLKDIFNTSGGSESIANAAENLLNFAGNSASSIGGLDVTKFANAIADIMIERGKQELTVAFFNRFQKYAESNPEFETLFPSTTRNLSNLLTYTYPQMLPKLRSGFLEDITQITYNLEALLELPKYRTLLDNFPEVRIAIRSLKLIHQLENGDLNAAQIIKEFSEFDEWTNSKGSLAFKNMGSTIQFAALFSESLRDTVGTSRIWVSGKEAKALVNDEIFTKIYLGLLYQQIKNKNIEYYFDPKNPTVGTPLIVLFGNQKENILLMQNKISQFISMAEAVNNAYKDIKQKNSDKVKLTNEDYFNYIGVSIDVVDFSFGLVKVFDNKLVVDDYLDIARKSNNLYKDIYTKQYTQAISDGLDVILKVQELTKKSSSTITDSKIQGAAKYTVASDSLFDFIEDVKPYAIFMANIIEAKDEAGVKAALENAILPVGSSSIKKNTEWNISVQSYLGAYFSLSDVSTVASSQWTDKFGVIAPIGISFTPGFLSWRKGGSLSLFGSLLDLGAIVDYKLVQDSVVSSTGSNTSVVSKDYSIKLGQIFSPGVYAVYGFFGNLPISLGIGTQYGPGLSKIDAGGNTIVGNPSWRWNIFLAVDMPFFTLKNKIKVKSK